MWRVTRIPARVSVMGVRVAQRSRVGWHFGTVWARRRVDATRGDFARYDWWSWYLVARRRRSGRGAWPRRLESSDMNASRDIRSPGLRVGVRMTTGHTWQVAGAAMGLTRLPVIRGKSTRRPTPPVSGQRSASALLLTGDQHRADPATRSRVSDEDREPTLPGLGALGGEHPVRDGAAV